MKIVAITGGGQGIGRATAFHFAKAGYAVSLCDADAAAGREAAKILRETGTPAFFLRADVAKEKDVMAWIQGTVRALGRPDVLVNNAGISRNGPFLKLKPKDFDRVIAINLRGAFLCGQASRASWRRAGKAVRSSTSPRPALSCRKPTPRPIPRPRAASPR